MLDELLDLFERKSSSHGKRQGGVRGMLNRLTGREDDMPRHRRDPRVTSIDDDDDDDAYRRRRRDDDDERYDARRREDDDRSYARRRDDDDDRRYSRDHDDDDDDRYPRRRKRRAFGDLFDFE